MIALDCPDNTFDFVYASNLLHHLPDPETAIREMHRVLKPGGKACLVGHNSVINVYRRIATSVRTEDETPLILILSVLKSQFSRTTYDTFWLATLWIFLLLFNERVDPNQERYWKKIIVEQARLEPGSAVRS